MDIPQLIPLNILLVGDSCSDEYLFGRAERLSPEAPVPIFDVERRESKGGMAANVFNNLVSLGNKVDFATNRHTTKKIRVIDLKSNQQLLRLDEGKQIDCFEIESVFTSPAKYDALVISDYDKGFLSLESMIELINMAQKNDIPVFIDSKKTNLFGVKNCFIKINQKEYDSLTIYPEGNEFIVTLGPNGASWKDCIIPAKKRFVFDVCGAGDTFLAAFVSSYMSIRNIIKSIEFANECASISVTKMGCHIISLSELGS